jgi:hypothetical protein
MGYELTCKICGCPIIIGDDVESKAGGLRPKKEDKDRGRKRTPKFYHLECYNNFHLSFDKQGKPLNGSGIPIEQISDEDMEGIKEDEGK